MSRFAAFVFDFDGVLADSVEVKTRAFAELYRPHGETVTQAVARFHREHGGMTRREKFRHFESEILGRDGNETELDRLCASFSALVLEGVIAAPEIPGANDFLRRWHGRVPLFVNSATPDGELRVILAARGMAGYFEAAFGSSQTKAENLADILARGSFAPEKTLFFGDALSDYAAAKHCGTDFLGIVRTPDSPLARLSPMPHRCNDFIEADRLLTEGLL